VEEEEAESLLLVSDELDELDDVEDFFDEESFL